ncbi:hypothetical protein TREES_T100014647 [Tupaia chinensis]|uniref:Uncharacterized protein n=1 Tax=Tupaia chinensis TaxID=246437 RepID=L9KY40_TUPCH|nr:hypothetical protein TREES_T100014647 [Tupaia chinensis]
MPQSAAEGLQLAVFPAAWALPVAQPPLSLDPDEGFTACGLDHPDFTEQHRLLHAGLPAALLWLPVSRLGAVYAWGFVISC